MIKAICVLSVDAHGELGATWVPSKTSKPFKKPDVIQIMGLGGRPKIIFKESPFEPGAKLEAKTYEALEDSGFSLAVKTDATVDKTFKFSCELILPNGKVVTYAAGDDVPVKNP